MAENLSREQKLIEEIPVNGLFSGPVGRQGYEVVVLRQIGDGGSQFHCTLKPGEALNFSDRLFGKFIALVVDIRYGLSFQIERPFPVYERGRIIKVQAKVRYRVTDAQTAATGHVDPLAELRDKVVSTLVGELGRHKEASITSNTIREIIRSVGSVVHLGLMVEDAEILNFASDTRVTKYVMEREQLTAQIDLNDIQNQAKRTEQIRQEEINLDIQSRRHEQDLRHTQERNAAIDLTDIRTLMQHHPNMIPQIFQTFTQREQQTLQMQQNLVTKAIDAYIQRQHADGLDVDPNAITHIMRQFADSGQSSTKRLTDGHIVLGDDMSRSSGRTTDNPNSGSQDKDDKPHIVLGN